MNDNHYGWVVNTHYYYNMLTRMKDKNPRRFREFQYSRTHIYDCIHKLQHEQNLQD
jgi:hypothetical protein